MAIIRKGPAQKGQRASISPDKTRDPNVTATAGNGMAPVKKSTRRGK